MTDWRLDAIVRLHKLTGADETTVARVQESNRLFGIKVYAQDIQRVGLRDCGTAGLRDTYGRPSRRQWCWQIRLPHRLRTTCSL